MDSKKRKVEENGESDSEVSAEDVRSLMEPLSKEQLMDLLQEAAMEHADILQEIKDLADKDPSHRKLFVHGLGWETSSDTLKAAFAPYGDIEECLVITDKKTGKGKGYGFVTFKHRDGAQRALKEPSKKIDGRKCVCQFASAGPSSAQSQLAQAASTSARKIYVANVPRDMPAEKLLAAFSKYGEIEEGPLGFDKQTGKSKGYALFIYKSADSVKRALEEPTKTVEGHQMTCKLAEGQKQKTAAVDNQTTGLVAPASSLINSAALSGLLPLNQGILNQHSALAAQGLFSGLTPSASLASLYPSLGSSIAQQLALNPSLGSSLSSSLNPSLTPSLSASLNGSLGQGHGQGLSQQGLGQSQSSMSNPFGLSGLGVYGSQVGGLGGAGGVDSSLYGLSSTSQSGLLQGSGGAHTAGGSRVPSLSSYYGK